MDCLGLAVEWEASVELRERVRVHKKILLRGEKETFCQPNRLNAVRNSMVLEPVLTRLAATPSFRLPHLEDLQLQVATLHEKCGLPMGDKSVYKTSVEIKKLTGFVKRRCNRKEVTKDSLY